MTLLAVLLWLFLGSVIGALACGGAILYCVVTKRQAGEK
jgi:hypothetical protein